MSVQHLGIKGRLIVRARSCIGVSTWRKEATLAEAPQVFNCFRFTQWLWHPLGVLLPDQQLTWSGAIPVLLGEVEIADLIFVPRRHYALDTDDFGHVGIVTAENTVIHATKWKNNVVEDPLESFVARGVLGARRIPL